MPWHFAAREAEAYRRRKATRAAAAALVRDEARLDRIEAAALREFDATREAAAARDLDARYADAANRAVILQWLIEHRAGDAGA